MPADIYVVLHIRLGCPCPMAAAIAEDAVAFIEAVSVQATDAEKEAADIEKQVEKAAAAEPVTAESAASSAAGTEGQVAQEVADSRPARQAGYKVPFPLPKTGTDRLSFRYFPPEAHKHAPNTSPQKPGFPGPQTTAADSPLPAPLPLCSRSCWRRARRIYGHVRQ